MRRILSIDGGGIRGVFPASLLSEVEDAIGSPVANYFDLIVGTSTGGIIALGLGLGFTARDILSFYQEHGPRIFAGRRAMRFFRSLRLPKYDSAPLKEALEQTFGDRRLGESTKRLVIPSCSLVTGEVYLWKTAHHPRLESDYRKRVIDVALSTAAAPTYFPAHQLASGLPLIDGGVWSNNPTGVAVVEAIGVLGWAPDLLRVLSIGCTSSPLNAHQGARRGLAYWGPRIADVFMTAQSSGAMGTAANLIGDRANLVRVSPRLAGGFDLDSVSAIDILTGLGTSEARTVLPLLRDRFLSEPAEIFVPTHQL